jgi:hypothetical protein
MEILGITFSQTGLLICGVSTVCCLLPAFLVVFVGARFSVVSVGFSLISNLFNNFFEGGISNFFGGNDDEETEIPDAEAADQRERRHVMAMRAKMQAADQQFDQQLGRKLENQNYQGQNFDVSGSRRDPNKQAPRGRPGLKRDDVPFDPQIPPPQRGSVPETDDTPFDPEIHPPRDSTNNSRFGVRKNPREPNRILRDKRYDRNQGPENIPDEVYDGLTDGEGNPRHNPDEFDLDGPASPPGLRGRDFDGPSDRRRNKPFRDGRKREQWDDEAMGGWFDEDGDGFADY